jgi:hypothetical protein
MAHPWRKRRFLGHGMLLLAALLLSAPGQVKEVFCLSAIGGVSVHADGVAGVRAADGHACHPCGGPAHQAPPGSGLSRLPCFCMHLPIEGDSGFFESSLHRLGGPDGMDRAAGPPPSCLLGEGLRSLHSGAIPRTEHPFAGHLTSLRTILLLI